MSWALYLGVILPTGGAGERAGLWRVDELGRVYCGKWERGWNVIFREGRGRVSVAWARLGHCPAPSNGCPQGSRTLG